MNGHLDLNLNELLAALPPDVLRRCHQGLLTGASGVGEAEATWVVRRLAELAEWIWPEPNPPE